jgi:hypothetical protein
MATNRVLAFLAIRLPFSPQIRLGIETEGCAKLAFLKQSDPADFVRLRRRFWVRLAASLAMRSPLGSGA